LIAASFFLNQPSQKLPVKAKSSPGLSTAV
jgi:hypothetical protein